MGWAGPECIMGQFTIWDGLGSSDRKPNAGPKKIYKPISAWPGLLNGQAWA